MYIHTYLFIITISKCYFKIKFIKIKFIKTNLLRGNSHCSSRGSSHSVTAVISEEYRRRPPSTIFTRGMEGTTSDFEGTTARPS